MNKNKEVLATACKNYEEDLVLHYYGDASEAESRRVESHLRECAACRRFLEDLRHFLPSMSKTKELPDAFWDGYYRELLGKLDAAEERRGWWRRLALFWPVPALGTAAVLILAVGLLFTMPTLPWRANRNTDTIPREILGDETNVEFFKSLDLLESLQQLESIEARETGSDTTQTL
jgi:hypothetical protein